MFLISLFFILICYDKGTVLVGCVAKVSKVTSTLYSNPWYQTFINNDLDFSWNYDNKFITFRLCTKQDFNIIGLGFSDYEEITNADVIVMWRSRENQAWVFADMNSDVEEILHQDLINNYEVSLVNIEDLTENLYCFDITRQINTNDSDDYQIDRGTTHIFTITDKVENIDDLEGFNLADLNTVNQRVQLIKTSIKVPDLPADTEILEVLAPNVTIPSIPTTYWCFRTKLPLLTERRHIVKVEGIISLGSVSIVHHMEVFHCENVDDSELPEYNAPCNSETKPMGLGTCRKVIGAWAMGATAFSYPEEAGYSIGGENYSRVIVLEVHYNNIEKQSGIVDNSGIRFYITKNIRKFDAGIIELGLEYNAKNSIPPHQKAFSLSGFCTSECTERAFGDYEHIVVFGSQLHTHLTGKQVITQHFRGNEKLEDLNHDFHYSPHFQEIRLLPHMVTVKKGDVLVNKCIYDTSDKTNMTFGGIAISDEMCLNYIYYYPAVELEVCKSSISDHDLNRYFQSKGLRIPDNDDEVRDNFNAIIWNDYESDKLHELYGTRKIHMSCNNSAAVEIENGYYQDWNKIDISEYYSEQ